jgi:hypothetical protein
MKKKIILSLIIAVIVVACCPNANAQSSTPEKFTVNATDLTVEQLTKIKAEQTAAELQKKLDTYGKWVGVGGEVGTAVKEGLNAVVDVADKFGKTDVGRFTMIMIAWKVVGKDFMRIIIGLIFMFIVTFFIFRSYKNMCTRRIVVKDNGWKFWLPKEYEIIQGAEYEGVEFVKVLHIFFFAGAIGLTYAIMFG